MAKNLESEGTYTRWSLALMHVIQLTESAAGAAN